MPSVESFLTRALDVRFVDARSMVTEARLGLGIDGYPTQDQLCELREEALRIFHSKTEHDRRSMLRQNSDLEAAKISQGSMSMTEYMDSSMALPNRTPSMASSASSDTSSGRGHFRR